MRLRHVFALAFVLCAAAGAGFLLARALRSTPPAVAAPMLEIGDLRPELELADLAGAKVALARYDGRPLLLNFWASWCPPCTAEMPMLDAFARAHPELQVVGVAVEPAQAARDYLAEHPVGYPILLGSADSPDESALFGNRRGVLPYTVLIGADGRIRKRRAGAFTEDELRDWIR
jgi:thiol-disulfide isomerase/thioredoxin